MTIPEVLFYNFQTCLNNMGRIRIQNSKNSWPDPEKSFRIHNTGNTVCQVLTDIPHLVPYLSKQQYENSSIL